MKSLPILVTFLSVLASFKHGILGALPSGLSKISGLQFGPMSSFTKTNNSVFHLEEDIFVPGNILYTDMYTLMTTDGKTNDVIVGSEKYGFVEGKGTQAQFRDLTGFLQTHSSHVLVVDSGNSCLRFVSRLTNLSSPFVGNCTSYGTVDGQHRHSRFARPGTVVKDLSSIHTAIVTDYGSRALRSVDLVTGDVRTLTQSLPGSPVGAAFGSNYEDLYITFSNFLGKFNVKSSTFSVLTQNRFGGEVDGIFSEASFSTARGILHISNNVFLVADSRANKLRIVDVNKQTVHSFCADQGVLFDGPTYCAIREPFSLMRRSNTLYIGQARTISSIAELYACQNNPCLNTGICTAGLNNTYTCACKDGWTGKICQTEVNSCTFNPCQKGGKCTAMNSTFQCSCLAGWTGVTCETEVNQSACGSEIYEIADAKTMRAMLKLPDGDEITLPVGKYIYKKRLSQNISCEVTVHVSDPKLKNRLDISAKYNIPCNQLTDFRSVIQSVGKVRYSQIKQITSGFCNQSAVGNLEMSCTEDVLQVTWPTDCLFDSTLSKEKERLLGVINEYLQKNNGSLLELIMLNHMPPIIQPSLNHLGLPASVVLTPVCSEGLKYMSNTETCQ